MSQTKVIETTGEIVYSPFTGRSDHVRRKGQVFIKKDKNDIVEYGIKDIVRKVGEGETDYVIEHKVVETSRKNRQALINSYRNDVGILNILKKCALAGENAADGRFASKDQFVDLTKLPSSTEEAYSKVEKGVNAFDKLPEDMKKKMSMELFVKTFGAEEIQKYVKDHMPKQESVEAPVPGNEEK